MTSSLWSIQKSTSKSGKSIRSGFKKRSNNKSYLIGSSSVISREYATSEPAPEPLPGPTGIVFSLAQRIKSATIKK